MARPRRIPIPVAQQKLGWIALDDVFSAIEVSLQHADARMSASDGELQFVVTDLTVNFPAELHTDRGRRALVRIPSELPTGQPTIPGDRLARLTVSMKPTPRLEQAPVSTRRTAKPS